MSSVLLRAGRLLADPVEGTVLRQAAMLVVDETVAWLGPADLAPAAGDVDEVVDGRAALVLPAFVDAHVHCTATGLTLTGLDLSSARSLGECLDLVAAAARQRTDEVLLGTGWDETRWPEHRAPTRAEIDRAVGGARVYLARADVHSALVSSALLRACPQAVELPGFATDRPLRLDAHHAVRAAAYAGLPVDQVTDAQRATRRRAAALGIGCLHEMAGPQICGEADLAGLLTLAAAEPGPQVVGYWGALGDVDTPRRLGVRSGGDLFVDGALGSHTAALTARYVDEDTCGQLRYDAADIADHVAACTAVGLQTGFHAIGDRALEAVLGGVEVAAQRVGVAAVARCRHRIEHAEMLNATAVARFPGLGLVASVQPAFDAAWGGRHGMYAERLGTIRAATLNPFSALAEAGVPLAFGSDAPVTPLDPWGTLTAAVHHRTPGFGLTPAAALAAHTVGGWLAIGDPAGGRLTVGAPATYAVWDVPASSPDGLPELISSPDAPICLRTVVRGRTSYDRASHDEGALR